MSPRRGAARCVMLAAPLVFSACADGRSVLAVTVESTMGAVQGIGALRVTVLHEDQDAGPYTLETAGEGAGISIPPAQTFTLSFDSRQRGEVAVMVEALDLARSRVIATGSQSGTITPSTVTQLLVDLQPGPPASDGGAGDGPDLANGDAAPDLAAPCGERGSRCCTLADGPGPPCRSGCCGAGTCVDGNERSACGMAGTACADCAMSGSGHGCYGGACGCMIAAECADGFACDIANRSCTATCGANTTPCNGGCCTGGACTAGSLEHACGTTGGLCVDCAQSSDGHVCVERHCGCTVAADCPVGNACDNVRHLCTPMCLGQFLCNGGCCDGNMCLPGTADTTCGNVGGRCLPCGGATPTCTGGTCTSACTSDGKGAAACGQGHCCNAMNACVASGPQSCGEGTGCTDCTRGSDGNLCLAGKCGCNGPADCPAGRACIGNTCRTMGCGPQSPCNGGCCTAGACAAGNQATACGATGLACVDCAGNPAGRACVAGACGCNAAADCPAGNACGAQTHRCSTTCDTATPCNTGCCSSAMNGLCLDGKQAMTCGNTGGLCADCPAGFAGNLTGRVCVAAAGGGVCGCSSGADCPNGQSCNAGLCTSACSANQPCSTGCCSAAMNGTCLLGTGNNACGKNGVCADCANAQAGRVCIPNQQKCGCNVAADCPAGRSCNRGTSQCEAACGSMAHTACNGGCCSGGTCVAGMANQACGLAGASCVNCAISDSGKVCLNGGCGCNVAADCPLGMACDAGAHLCTSACNNARPCNGGCCTAAQNGACVAGTQNSQCGGGGGLCTSCGNGTPTCAAGVCTSECNRPGNGVCDRGYCCAPNNRCVAGNTQGACGYSGTCVGCMGNSSGTACQTGAQAGPWFCGCADASQCLLHYACGALTPRLCSQTCGGGTPCNGGCCNGMNACVSGVAATSCGSTGGACADCVAAGKGKACVEINGASVCGCNTGSDCNTLEACNTTSHACDNACGGKDDSGCNGGCCAGGRCSRPTDRTTCGPVGGACQDCSAGSIQTPACVPDGQGGGACGCRVDQECGNNGACSGGRCCGARNYKCNQVPALPCCPGLGCLILFNTCQ